MNTCKFKKIFFLILSGICCLNILTAQIPEKPTPSGFERLLQKNLRYPDELVDSVSGYVIFEVQRQESDSIFFMNVYNSHPRLAEEVYSITNRIERKDWEKFEYVIGKKIVVEFITYSYPAKKLIPQKEAMSFVESLGSYDHSINIKIEGGTICKKYELSPTIPAQTKKEIPNKPK